MITLEPLTTDNYLLVRKWRNHDRHYFINSGIISQKQHANWFKQYQQNPTQFMYLVTYQNKPMGTCGVTLVDNNQIKIERVILGDKSLQRQNIMSQALKLLLKNTLPNGII